MKSSESIECSRKSIYSNFSGNENVLLNESLLYVFNIKQKEYKNLQQCAKNIICKLLKKNTVIDTKYFKNIMIKIVMTFLIYLISLQMVK